ncbi:hypothetical protein [Floridanema aerugineum]|uniref:TIGR02588 family protein n=1 Tax=Floridaenema aerugineum BLCC-F46 TaxID=3153654 RepID=A0ABV4XAE7_9CYAN
MKKLEKNWLEWVIFAVGLILVVSTLGYLIYDATTSSEAPPNIEVKLGEIQPQGQNFLVPVIATNKGEQTAETVQIEVVLEKDGKEAESAELQIQFLPRGAKRSGWVTFETDPRTVEKIKTRAVGFEKP